MQKDYTISSGKNAMSESGIMKVYFDTFTSKSGLGIALINNYKRSCSIDFKCCYFTGKVTLEGNRTPIKEKEFSEERDEETGYGYFGARYMDHELMTMWLSVDPMLDKYPNVSPYNYCMWNPVKLVDPDGKDIWIIDGNESIKYTAGMSSAGFTGFSEQAITALNEIHQTDEGKLMLDFLVDADISVSISFDYNTHNDLDQVRYDPDAYFNVETNMPGTGLGFICDISWNSIESGGQQCVNGIDRNTTLDLADEIAHAYDAGNGWAYRYIEKKGKVVVDEGMVNGYDKREFQAAYRVNIIREQMGNKNYRTKYYSNLPIADKETFYKPCWYTLRSTDKTQRFTFDIP